MLKISWRPTATDDLAEIIAYIAERSPQAARNIKLRIESAVLPVSEHSYLHRSGMTMGLPLEILDLEPA